MLSVLLLILKIIGITLLAIIGLILLIILLLLFVPVRYSGDTYVKKLDEDKVKTDQDGRITEEKNIDLDVKAKITWLLHFVSFSLQYSDDLSYKVKILGIPFMKSDSEEEQKKVKKDKKKKKKKKEKEDGDTEEADQEKDQQIDNGSGKDNEIETGTEQDNIAENVEETVEETTQETKPETDTDKEQDNKKEKKGKKKDKKNKEDSVEGEEKQSVVEKIKNIYNKVTGLLEDRKVQRAYELVKVQLVKLVKAVVPRKIGGYAKYGFENPAITGYITAFLAAEYGRVRNLDIEPHFEDEILEGELTFKGRIFMITMLKIGCKVYFNKDVKYTIKKLKEFKESSDEPNETDKITEKDTEA